MKIVAKLTSSVFVVALLFSCSTNTTPEPPKPLIGTWGLVTLDDLNAQQKLQYEDEGYDPVVSVRVTYRSDGTGYSVAEFQREEKYEQNFSYYFVSRSNFRSVALNNQGYQDVIHETEVISIDNNRHIQMLVGSFTNGKEERFKPVENPLALTFRRVN